MKKSGRKTTSTKKTRSAKRDSATLASSQANQAATVPDGKLNFNHAMIYVADVERGLGFYRDLLGFKLIEDFQHENKPVYARLRAPGGEGTIALHQAGPGASVASEGVRLYLEVRELDDFCR